MLDLTYVDNQIKDLILHIDFNSNENTFEIHVTIDFEVVKFNYGIVTLNLSDINSLENLEAIIYQKVLNDISINLYDNNQLHDICNLSKSQPLYSNFIISNNSLITDKKFFISIFVSENYDVTVSLNITRMKDIIFSFKLNNILCKDNIELLILKTAEQYILELTKFDTLLNSSIQSFFSEYFTLENKNLFRDYLELTYLNNNHDLHNLINEFIINVTVDNQKTFLNLNILVSGTNKDNEFNMQIENNESIKLSFNYLQNHLQNFIINNLYHFRYDFEDAIWQFNYKNFEFDYEIRNKFKANIYKNDFTFKQLQQSVAYNLQSLRKDRNYTQEKLAELCECSPITISSLETQTRVPSLNLIFKLSKSLEVSVTEFFY